MSDDPLYPLNLTADGQTFRDWIDFVDRVARPLVEDDADWDGELGDLYRKASPYFICVALLMAYNRAHPEPTRFDLDDRSTWPEDGRDVLASYRGMTADWAVRTFTVDEGVPTWFRDDGHSFAAEAGDLWLPLPPTPEVQG